MKLDELGTYRPVRTTDAAISGDMEPICPFADKARDETAIGDSLFGSSAPHDSRIGRYHALYAGHVATAEFRLRGSSGGFGSWLPANLIKSGIVDAVLHVKPLAPASEGGRPLFGFQLSRDASEIQAGAKSRYYPVEFSELRELLAATPGRVAVVGLPCFIKALRLMALADPSIGDRIAVTIGLVCGHLKSTRFADYLAWQGGIAPGTLRAIDFRHKLPGRAAMDYGVRAIGPDGTPVDLPMRSLFGHQWGYGLFKLQACDFCDDVLAETADITIGDAWIPPYESDPAGTNIVVVRRPDLVGIIEEARTTGEIMLDPLDADAVGHSQAGGLRHRRQGLAVRLAEKDRNGEWRPQKRIAAAPDLRGRFAKMHLHRMSVSAESHVAFAEALARRKADYFAQRMGPLMRRLDRLSRSPFQNVMRSPVAMALARLTPAILKRLLRRLAGRRGR